MISLFSTEKDVTNNGLILCMEYHFTSLQNHAGLVQKTTFRTFLEPKLEGPIGKITLNLFQEHQQKKIVCTIFEVLRSCIIVSDTESRVYTS